MLMKIQFDMYHKSSGPGFCGRHDRYNGLIIEFSIIPAEGD